MFIAPLPEPVTGQSLACQVLLDALRRDHTVEVVDLSKRTVGDQRSSATRAASVLRIIRAIRRHQRSADVIYLTVSESRLGNVKDLFIYLVCFANLRRMVVHLYGGAGLRGIMLTNSSPHGAANRFLVSRLGGAVVEGNRQVPTFRSALPPDRIHVVPNFAQNHLFVTTDVIDQKFANPVPLRVLFLSNLLPGKGHQELVEAIRLLEPQLRMAVAVDIAGGFESTADERAFRGKVEDLPSITVHGPVRGERRTELFRRAHLFCLPTSYAYEGQPLSILEAYASGCAVVTTDHSGIPDVFASEVNGFTVEQRSPASVAAAIQRSLADPARLRTMAHANRDVAERSHRPGHFVGKMIPIIDAVSRAGR